MRIFNLIEGVWGHKRDVGFEVERKNPPLNPLQGGEFEKIGFIEGHGNSNSPSIAYVHRTLVPLTLWDTITFFAR